MKICGLEKMSLVDYDGFVAATVFTGGCNFKCGFCHNSSLVLESASLPSFSEEDVLSYLNKRTGVLDAVCISGGEPTLQKDLPLFCEKVKALGYKIKLDTNGTAPNLVKTLNENGLVDYFAMDIKSDKKGYAKVIDIENYNTNKIEQTVEYFLSGKADYEFRTTLIAEYHTESDVINIGEWLKGAHKYFLQKFKNSESCILSHLSAVDEKTVLKFVDILRKYIPNTYLRGYDL